MLSYLIVLFYSNYFETFRSGPIKSSTRVLLNLGEHLWIDNRLKLNIHKTFIWYSESTLICFTSSRSEVFSKISQNSPENTCASVSLLIKLQAWGLRSATLLKKRLWHLCFSVSFAKFVRISIFTEHLRWLFLMFLVRSVVGVTRASKQILA